MSASSPTTVLQNPALTWTGTTSSLFGIFFKNLLLTIVTLGIYRFWAITSMRQYVWSNTRVAGMPLEYTGTGGELLRGFLMATGILLAVALVLIGLPLLLAHSGGAAFLALGGIGLFIFYLLLFLFGYAAIFLGRRYLMTRTQLAGIRFTQDGSPLAFAFHMLGRAFLVGITAGIHTPWMTAARLRETLGATRWGNLKFDFKGKGIELFGWYVAVFFGFMVVLFTLMTLIMPTFTPFHGPRGQIGFNPVDIIKLTVAYIAAMLVPGLILFAAMWRFVISNMSFDNDALQFKLNASFPQMMGLLFSNGLIVLLSLGLLTPIALHRVMQFFTRTITLTGSIDLARVTQAQPTGDQAADLIGAGMAI